MCDEVIMLRGFLGPGESYCRDGLASGSSEAEGWPRDVGEILEACERG